MLRDAAEALSIASGDGVSIRVRSSDGEWLLPLAAHHPNPTLQEAMWDAMRHTAIKPGQGLWEAVINERRTVAYDLTGEIPDNAAPAQVEFVKTYPVTHVVGAPVVLDDKIIGCVSLVRYVDRRPFSDNDCALLEDVAARVAVAIDFGHLAEMHSPD